MRELVVYNHIPKCAGSYVRDLLHASYGDAFMQFDNSSPRITQTINSYTRCISVEFSVGNWSSRMDDIERLYDHYDRVVWYGLLRHPFSRLISAARHSRRDGGYGFFPYLRYLRGCYSNNDFENSSILRSEQHGKAMFSSLSANDILTVLSEAQSVDLTWCCGQAIGLSLGCISNVIELNLQLKDRLTHLQCTLPNSRDEIETRRSIISILGLDRYKSIGTVENMGDFLDQLFEHGVLRERPSLLIKSTSPMINNGQTSQADTLCFANMIRFANMYPLDFVLWDMCFNSMAP